MFFSAKNQKKIQKTLDKAHETCYIIIRKNEREGTKMTELEMFVKMMDRAKSRIKIEEDDKETRVFVLDSEAESIFIFGEEGQLKEVW